MVADTANGMGGLVVPAVFEGLPFDLEVLFGELDGTFPNHPADPIQPENLVALRRRILETGADVGLAFDGDADRCFLVDDRGEPVSGSTTTALVAAAMLEKYPGATILYNLICSKAVPEIIRERGGTPVRTRVGHSYIKAIMADTDALFGGEHSGHYYFRDNFRADSGCIAALLVLEVLRQTGRPLSELRVDYERYADSGEINSTVSDPLAVIESVASHFAGAGVRQGPAGRVDGGSGDVVVQPAPVQYRAAPAAQPRSARRGGVPGVHRRGAGFDPGWVGAGGVGFGAVGVGVSGVGVGEVGGVGVGAGGGVRFRVAAAA